MPEIIRLLTIVLLVLAILKAFLAVRRIRATISSLDCSANPTCASQPPSVVIVLCVLREQAQLPQAVHHFRRLDYPDGRLRVLLVTTEREYAEPLETYNKTTIELARDLANENENVYWLHYSDTSGL